MWLGALCAAVNGAGFIVGIQDGRLDLLTAANAVGLILGVVMVALARKV